MSTHGSYTDDRTTQRFGEGQQSGFGHEGQQSGFGREGQQGGQQGGFGWGGQSQHQGRHRGEKPFFLTSEFLTLLASIAAIVIAAAVADNFGADRAWTLVTVLAAAYMVSRGLSKVARGDGRNDR
jgi:hypothetical protein